MKYIKLVVVLLLLTNTAFTQNYSPTDKGSKVYFVIKNFGLKTEGYFTGLKGTVVFNPKALNISQFNVSVNSATIDTDNGTRDGHLRKSEYFDAVKYPVISFLSTRIIESTLAGFYNVAGNLTIKGVTRVVQFNFTATPLTADGYSFKGEFNINRRDFGVGGKSISMSDDLKVMLDITAIKL